MSDESAERLQQARDAKPVAQQLFAGLLGDVAVGIARVGGRIWLENQSGISS